MASALLIIISCISFFSLIRDMQSEIYKPYSESKKISDYIVKHLPGNSIIVVTNDFKASSIVPYVGSRKLWNPINEKFFTFLIWDSTRIGTIDKRELIRRINETFPNNNNVYLLKMYPSTIPDIEKYDSTSPLVIVDDEKTITDESYYALYHIDTT
jgi:hypothetical protein